MPRFSEREKEIIESKLLTEGERLFIKHGLKKVTVDDLINIAGIAKGSFYSFYTNKEHLYMDILTNIQKKIWEAMDDFLDENKTLLPKELMKKLILWSFNEIKKFPLLMQQDTETTEYLFRKVPDEVLKAHTHDDSKALLKLMEYGIRFNCNLEIVVKTLQILFIAYTNLLNDDAAIIEILINGVINEIVIDEV